MQTITFYAYKGGTGRTLALANAARYLARLGQKVFAIDLDLEAPGLHHKLRLSVAESSPSIERGIVDVISPFARFGTIPQSLAPFTLEVPREVERDGQIILMPAGNPLAASYWRQLAELNWHKFFYEEGAEGVPFFLELKEQIRAEFSPDFLLIDARTGITEIGGVATALLPDMVVCLLLNNQENLQGAREVLRGIKRASLRRKRPIGIVPVLSRLPTSRRLASEVDGSWAARVHHFLCEPANDPEATLELPPVFILHAEDSLAFSESLRIGGDKSVDESPLLRDYLHLFAQIIPSERVEPHLDQLIDAAMRDIVEKPDRVQSDLEALAIYCPHPKSYIALLKFYRLRNLGSAKMMQTATRYWELSGQSGHPLLWEVVQEHFRPDRGTGRRETEVTISTSDMVEAVWTDSGAGDPDVALRLIELLYRTGRNHRARLVVVRMLEGPEVPEKVVVECISRAIEAKDYELADRLVGDWASKLAEYPDFQAAWASLIVGREDVAAAKKFFESKEIRPASILAKQPLIYSRLLALAGRKEELEATLRNSLVELIETGGPESVLNLYHVFSSFGMSDLFRDKVKEVFPPRRAEEILSWVHGRSRPRTRPMFSSKSDDYITF
jgi:hypothetical protein